MLSILIAAALVLPPPVPEPQHLRRNEYGYVVDTPGDPELMTFEFRAEPTNEYIPLEIGVHRMLDDEPYEIVEMDPAAGRVVLRTSSVTVMSLVTWTSGSTTCRSSCPSEALSRVE